VLVAGNADPDDLCETSPNSTTSQSAFGKTPWLAFMGSERIVTVSYVSVNSSKVNTGVGTGVGTIRELDNTGVGQFMHSIGTSTNGPGAAIRLGAPLSIVSCSGQDRDQKTPMQLLISDRGNVSLNRQHHRLRKATIWG
jgi:hypothetical protein